MAHSSVFSHSIGPQIQDNLLMKHLAVLWTPFCHCSNIIFAAGAEAERQDNSKRLVFQHAAHIQGLGLPLPSSL